jgi:hypothetical protein
MRFAEYLKELLEKRGKRPIRLAEGIGVDSSVVYKWLKDTNAPGFGSEHVNNIKEFLALDDQEFALLKQAQATSLREKQPPPPLWTVAPAHLYGAKGMIEAAINLIAKLPAPPEDQSQDAHLLTFQQWQQRQQEPKDQSPGAILMTFQGQDAFSKFKKLHGDWHDACYRAMEQGWDVHHLWKLGSPTSEQGVHTSHERALHLVKESLKALGTAHYFPHYFKQHERLLPPYDLLILPAQESALWFFACEGPDYVDAALRFQGAPIIRRLQGHFAQLVAQTEPLFRGYWLRRSVAEKQQFWDDLEEAEEKPGARLLVKRTGLSTLTRPPSWYARGAQWPREAQETEIDYHWIQRHYERRLKAFHSKIETYDYWEICSRQAIIDLVKTKIYPRDNVLGTSYTSDAEQVRAHLKHIIYLLRNHERYQLALLDPTEAANIFSGPFWEVAGDHCVLLQAWGHDARGNEVELGMKISEKTIVRAFQEHFYQLWADRASIDPDHKDKHLVIGWLEHQIEELDEEVD